MNILAAFKRDDDMSDPDQFPAVQAVVAAAFRKPGALQLAEHNLRAARETRAHAAAEHTAACRANMDDPNAHGALAAIREAQERLADAEATVAIARAEVESKRAAAQPAYDAAVNPALVVARAEVAEKLDALMYALRTLEDAGNAAAGGGWTVPRFLRVSVPEVVGLLRRARGIVQK